MVVLVQHEENVTSWVWMSRNLVTVLAEGWMQRLLFATKGGNPWGWKLLLFAPLTDERIFFSPSAFRDFSP